ncbi:hypothetical protein L3Q82_021686 [Scortum barcoo]|uniref:Uncharacterized protein n=1 Tax=Scortum barcoo TaxID=214431 RepID=A0ACB8X5C6_9TELE|nr:hypothetical protein L3Q82_021686 [Scortum barcoo]
MWKTPRRFFLTGRLCCFPKDPLEDVETWSESVDKVLGCKAGQIAFREFLKSEYSEENILFWLACEEYKKIKTVPEMISSANRIYSEFVQTEAPKQVNDCKSTKEDSSDIVAVAVLTTLQEQPDTHIQSIVAMPSLVASPPRDLQHPTMDTDNKKKEKDGGGNLKSRLQCKSSQAPTTKGLCFEEMSQWSQSLERLLSSKYGMKIFQAFLKSEFSDENIEFWLVCEDYKKIKSSFRMSSRAKKIFKRYIQAEAAREINIDYKTRELIRRNIQAPTTVCFDDAQRIVYGLMERDSYPRFLRKETKETNETRLLGQSLETLLSQKCGQIAFRNFLKSEFSEENLDFWLACQEFKAFDSPEELTRRAASIYHDFISDESPKQVNLDFYTREIISQSLQQPSPSCFVVAQSKIYSLMENDSFPRFTQSEQYKILFDAASKPRGLGKHRKALKTKSTGDLLQYDSKPIMPQSDL